MRIIFKKSTQEPMALNKQRNTVYPFSNPKKFKTKGSKKESITQGIMEMMIKRFFWMGSVENTKLNKPFNPQNGLLEEIKFGINSAWMNSCNAIKASIARLYSIIDRFKVNVRESFCKK